ncbi:MAG TPA: aminopeptidase P family protein [Desulfarculaceae bacterium]|nr:aminopeptidase P family protein [Desulfarculaceae bacterium]
MDNRDTFPTSYKLVPASEIRQRLKRAQTALSEAGCSGILILQNVDRYYFTGTLQDGILWIPDTGTPIFWVRRSLERAQLESPLADIRPQPTDFSALKNELRAAVSSSAADIGMELDVVPVRLLTRFQKLLPDNCTIFDASQLIRNLRARKSAYEIDCIKKAAAIMDDIMSYAATIIIEGISEIELMAELEHQARRLGHLGIVRMRGFNNELFFGHALTGPESARRGYLDAPTNGLGLSPAFSQGAGHSKIRYGVPISIDFMVNYEGYLADMTRMFAIGEPPAEIVNIHEKLLALNRELVLMLKPGSQCGAIYAKAMAVAADFGFGDCFLGHGPDQVAFVGHGVGLEVDEFPFIASNNNMVLAANMVVALEPKLTFPPGHKTLATMPILTATAVTTETTYVITRDSALPLTLTPEKIKIIKR